MTQYARSDIHAVTCVAGGVHTLDNRADEDYDGLSVDCAACLPILIADPLWAADPDEVPMTAAELKAKEKRERQEAQQASAAVGALMAQAIQAGAVAGPDVAPPPAKATRTRRTATAKRAPSV